MTLTHQMLTSPASASSVLGFVTTVHLGLAALRNHRGPSSLPINSLAIVSMLLASLPWVFPSPIGLAFGLLAHAAWFAACEAFAPRLAPRPVTKPAPKTAATAATARPSPQATGSLKNFSPATVLAVVDETPTIKTFRLARPEGFEFEAGQFLTVRVRVDGREHARCYSLSSAPEARGYLEVSVRRQGLVSNALHAAVRPGATLSIKGPTGAFKYPAADDRPVVLLAGGIGITPLISMLRHMVASAPTRPVTLLYSARAEQDLAFRDELSSMTRRHHQVRVQLAVSDGSGGPDVYPGRIDEALLRATSPDLSDSVCLICGPAPMIDATKALLASMGVPEAQIRHELFNAAIAASAAAPSKAEPVRSTAHASAHQMTCARVGRQVPIAAEQTLLEAAEDAQVPVESLCRAGVCGTCRVKVVSGETNCASDTLDPQDQERGYVLACVTTAQSDCTVDL